MSSIGASVGEGGANRESDVRIVQQLLTKAGHDPRGVDGDYGTNTRDAIISFQKTFMAKPDGCIDPNGATIRRLEQGSNPASKPVAASADGAKVGDWSGDSSQWTQEKKLASLEPSFRPRIERVIAKLKDSGFQPKIVFGWRSVAVQKKLKAEGKTTVSFSFHNAQKPNGTPNAWAVDLIDARWSWNEPDCHKFFKALGAAGKAEGLVWGGDWKSFRDWAHLQGRQNSELAQVKRESGLA
ncbi:peptidoglycan-binding protein [Allosphingosinicella sp.]|jgi:peptidoglycan L-alanyl-D-glutamate endopeptidase CwlK|uniref:peptidoglycan-binding protein n=1 Tax=Allosphingosinicella sp. TaxID=2823234 RepID=UPI002EFBC132